MLARLERLDLFRNLLDGEAVAALTATPHLAGLRRLNLGHNRLGREGIQHLASSAMTNLTHLDISSNGMPLDACRALVPWLARQRLVSLNLGHSYPGANLLRLLADCPGLECLVELDLGAAGIDEAEGARVLASAPWLGGVVKLNLSGARIGPDGLRDLLDSGRLGQVTELDLGLCRLGDRGAQLLADWPDLAGLLRLNLNANEIGDEGVTALADSPHLPPGLRLMLGRVENPFSDAAAGRLQERLGRRLNLRGYSY